MALAVQSYLFLDGTLVDEALLGFRHLQIKTEEKQW